SPGWCCRAAAARQTTRPTARSGAWRLSRGDAGYHARCRHLTRFDPQLPILELVVVFKQAALRRARGAEAVLVVHAAMAGTHEQAGLREPANRTSQMGAVHGKHLEFLAVDVSHPAGHIPGHSVPEIHDGIHIRGEPGLAGWKLFELAESEPRLVGSLSPVRYRRKEVAHEGNGQNCRHDAVEHNAEFHEESPPAHIAIAR